MPGAFDKFGFGLAINSQAVEGGRAAGSLAWAGIYNTFFWIDPARKTTAVLMMQLLPFMDDAAKNLLEEFESAVYGSARSKNLRKSAATNRHHSTQTRVAMPLALAR